MKDDTAKISKRISELLATPEPFIAWLKTKKAREVVGINSDCHECPIALFLAQDEQIGYASKRITVFTNDIFIHRLLTDSELVPMPDWAVAFIERVDKDSKPTKGVAKKKGKREVRANVALATMKYARREYDAFAKDRK